MEPDKDPATAWLFDPKNAKEVKRQLDEGLATGKITAFLNNAGHIVYRMTDRASQEQLANSLSLADVQNLRASRNRGSS